MAGHARGRHGEEQGGGLKALPLDRTRIDAIRTRVTDPDRVVDALGLDRGAKRNGNGWLVACPSHGDRTPSLSVRVGRDGTLQLRCFGCEVAGDVLTLVAAVERLDVQRDFTRVVERAEEIFGIDRTADPLPPRPAPAAPPPPPRLDADTFDAMMRPLQTLGRLDGRGISARATAYLVGRGLLADAIADDWFAISPACTSMLTDVFGADVVGKSGLVDVSGALVAPTHELAIPWRDRSGRIATIQRRRLDGVEGQKYLFPKGHGALEPYGVERLGARPSDTDVVLVEGAVDALARRRLDDRIVLAVPGVSWKPSGGWAQYVAGRVVRVAFDADDAGDAAAKKIATELAEAGARHIQRERLRRTKDWAAAGVSP